MSNTNTSDPPLPTPKTSRPVSEALLNEKVSHINDCSLAQLESLVAIFYALVSFKHCPWMVVHAQEDHKIWLTHCKNGHTDDAVTVGSSSFITSNTIWSWILFWSHLFSAVVQTESMASVLRDGLRRRESVGRG